MSLLGSLLRKSQPGQPYLLLQSSSSQSALPILKYLITQSTLSTTPPATHLVCLLYQPSHLIEDGNQHVHVHQFLANVPGYCQQYNDVGAFIIDVITKAPPDPLDIIIDSVDTLASDLGSDAETYKFLRKLATLIRTRPSASRLILHTVTPSHLSTLLTQSAFFSSLTHITAHPTVLLTHLASAYLTPPPPLSPDVKFWAVFLPFSERNYETDRLVYGPEGEGSGSQEEMVVQVLVRNGGQGMPRRRGVERSLEGWNTARNEPAELSELASLKRLWFTKKVIDEPVPDPTQNVSFNLNLTPSQQLSRAQVPLPYAHGGVQEKPTVTQNAAIFYDPDSADDIDDDDPDEDLDI